MTKKEKEEVLAMSTVATCWEDYPGGVEIKDIDYSGIEDRVLCVTQTMTDNPQVHSCKIYYDDRPYFRIGNYKIYCDDCLRC